MYYNISWFLCLFHVVFLVRVSTVFSDMFNSDLLEILTPILLEAYLFFTLGVKFGHDVVETGLEATLELQIVLISCPDDCLVVESVLNFDLVVDLILLLILLLWSSRLGRALCSSH